MLADDPGSGLALLQRARGGLGSLTVLAGGSPQELVGEFPVVPLESLLDVDAPSVTAEGFGYDPARGELWFVGETAEAVLLELQGRRRRSQAEAASSSALAEAAAATRARRLEPAGVAEAAFEAAPEAAARIDARLLLVRLVASAGALGRDRRRAHSAAASRRRCGPGSTPARRGRASSARSSRTLGAAEVGLRQELEEASER